MEEQPETLIYRSMSKTCTVVCMIVIVALSWAVGSSLYAQQDFIGKPKINIHDAGYYVWQDTEGWHLVTITGGQKRFFSGEIRVMNGIIEEVMPSDSGIPDKDITLLDSHTITFSFQGKKDFMGFEFKNKGEDPCVIFNLKIDDRVNKGNIFVGKGKMIPIQVPFSFCR
jgi:hypothetical protein